MQNQEIVKIIENLKGRRNYEEKRASKLGFASLYDYFEDKISKKQKAIDEEQKKIEDTKKLLGVSSENSFYHKYLSERVGITELTKMNEVDFEKKINEIIYSYEKLNIWEFTKKYFPSGMKIIQNEVDEVLVKKEVIWIKRREP